MTWVEAFVWVSAMFFGCVFFAILSHHVLERDRIEVSRKELKSSPVPYN